MDLNRLGLLFGTPYLALFELIQPIVALSPDSLLPQLLKLITFLAISQVVWYRLWRITEEYWKCSITVHSSDDSYDHILEFLEPYLPHARHFNIRSENQDLDGNDPESHARQDRRLTVLKNRVTSGQIYTETDPSLPVFGTEDDINALKFGPWNEQIRFSYRNRTLWLTVSERETDHQGETQPPTTLTISCLGRRADPIKLVIRDSRAQYYGRRKDFVQIRTPNPVPAWRGNHPWSKPISLSPRPMSTLFLSHELISSVISSLTWFFKSTTPAECRQKGMRWQLGYLFWGPPGTGKSTFPFVLAGTFGVTLYLISLSDNTINGLYLITLLANLPKRSIVLLEDIDAAGLRRSNGGMSDTNGGVTTESLLNAIDGHISAEGRVLIATTNHPEVLDPALLRPGRLDHIVEIGRMTEASIGNMFRHYYGDQERDIGGIASRVAVRLGSDLTTGAEWMNFLRERSADKVERDLDGFIAELTAARRSQPEARLVLEKTTSGTRTPEFGRSDKDMDGRGQTNIIGTMVRDIYGALRNGGVEDFVAAAFARKLPATLSRFLVTDRP